MTNDDEEEETTTSASRHLARARKRGLRLIWVLALVPLIALLYRVFELYHR